MVAFLDLVEVVLILSSISDVALSVVENVVIVPRRVCTHTQAHTVSKTDTFRLYTHTNGSITLQ